MPRLYRKYAKRSRKGTTRYLRRRYRGVGDDRGRMRGLGYKSAMLRLSTHHFKRRQSVEITDGRSIDLTNNVNGFVNQTNVFRLTDVVNSSEFTTLYDQYRINKVVLELKWSITEVGLTDVEINNPPILYYLRDYDDNASLTEDQYMENSRTKSLVLNPNRIYKLVLVPAQLQRVYNGTLSDGYAVKWKQWTDVGDPGVPHYGMKMGLKYPPNQDYGKLMINAIYYFSCKNAR